RLVMKKVKFSTTSRDVNKVCDEDNQKDVRPPYFEVEDIFNTTTRFCSFEGEYTIHAFGDFLKTRFVSDGSEDLIPDIQYTILEEEHCCGGVFYHKYSSSLKSNELSATTPGYPDFYNASTRCPYIFRCRPDKKGAKCKIQVHFVDFELESANQETFNRLDGRFPDENTMIVASEGPFANRVDNQTNGCKNKDQVWVSTCTTLFTSSAQRFCSVNEPSKSITAEEQILVYFQSNAKREDRGFLINYHAVDENGVSPPIKNSTAC
ncbi:unnamed protein product, partial [Meganyctiphanes norvegica]